MPDFCATCLRRRGADGCSCTADDASPTITFTPPPPALLPMAEETQPLSRFHSGKRRMTRGLVLAGVVTVVVATAVTTGVLMAGSREAPAGTPFAAGAVGSPGDGTDGTGSTDYPSTTISVPPLTSGTPATVADATATCTSGPGVDSAGNPFTYDATNAVDSQVDTAWRCDGAGTGAQLRITFSQAAEISWIGVIPGFAKTDPYDGTDRYAQGRKIAAARFVFDDGTYVEHTFDTGTASREMQVVRFPPTATTHVQMIVLASVPGAPTNGFVATDKIAVSELAVG
jgi:hypothetical protein